LNQKSFKLSQELFELASKKEFGEKEESLKEAESLKNKITEPFRA
jgi:hypothetical protein